MIPQADFWGRSRELTLTLSQTLGYGTRVVLVTAPTAAKLLNLPDARNLREGGPHFYLGNVGAETWTLRDNANNTLETVVAGDWVICNLIDNSTAAGIWSTQLRTALT
jgi:hypothetical protein